MSGTKLRTRSGVHGPSHDPYGWHELTVDRLGRRVTLRTSGLVPSQVYCNGVKVCDGRVSPELEVELVFEELTGLTPWDAAYYANRAYGDSLAALGFS